MEELRTEKTRWLVFNYIKSRLEKTDTHVIFSIDEVYVVTFSYVLGNWKAMVSTTLPDGMYYEVTYYSERKVTFLDAYKKWDDVEIPDNVPKWEEATASSDRVRDTNLNPAGPDRFA